MSPQAANADSGEKTFIEEEYKYGILLPVIISSVSQTWLRGLEYTTIGAPISVAWDVLTTRVALCHVAKLACALVQKDIALQALK
ncbi:hypothetical protein PM082_009647 [Marasmius tenuissimus]|nr:hypothetical protein PM082_009647 [Marasmius tenuissimus]